jgi:hypothetical protein
VDAGQAFVFDDASGGLESVHFRHAHIHQHDVRPKPSRGLYCLGAGRSFTYDLDVVCGAE